MREHMRQDALPFIRNGSKPVPDAPFRREKGCEALFMQIYHAGRPG
jgi:hypothetical protein